MEGKLANAGRPSLVGQPPSSVLRREGKVGASSDFSDKEAMDTQAMHNLADILITIFLALPEKEQRAYAPPPLSGSRR